MDGTLSNVLVSSITDGTFETGLDYLGYWLKRASDDWFARTGIRPDTVDIITHSTGGLLARSYIQSAAYAGQFDADGDGLDSEDPYLPKVHDLVLVGVPSEGTTKPWNMLCNNFGESMSTRVAGILIGAAYDDVQDGETIYGPDDSVATDDIVWNDLVSSPRGPQAEFVRRYVESLVDLLPTYDFINIDGTWVARPTSSQASRTSCCWT